MQLTRAPTSFADHPDMWAATQDKPGINFINVDDYTREDIVYIQKLVQQAREDHHAEVVVVSLHWGKYCKNKKIKNININISRFKLLLGASCSVSTFRT